LKLQLPCQETPEIQTSPQDWVIPGAEVWSRPWISHGYNYEHMQSVVVNKIVFLIDCLS
jgi:hypothetical protein